MAICNAQIGIQQKSSSSNCTSNLGCPDGICPDFVIKRHDTKPDFRVAVNDCDGPLDLTDETLVLEASMWSTAKLKTAIVAGDTYFALADNIGFDQVLVGDIIVMDRARLPEHMLVTGFDENNKLIQVQRGYNGTVASAWKKGTFMRIFRMMNVSAFIETKLEDITQEDGTILADQVASTFLYVNWRPQDTCLAGCFWLEFKLLKMSLESMQLSLMSTPSNISFTPSTLSTVDFGCYMGEGVEWVRRFPSDSEAFLIKVVDSPTAEV